VLAANRTLTPESWITNMDEAMKIAKNENKQILMNFTGSDWCPACIQLHDEVFEKAAFKAYAKQHFVLVEFDFPNKNKQTEAQKAHNNKWLEKYNIQYYPTVLISDAAGNTYAETSYLEGGAENYITHLKGLLSSKIKYDELVADQEAQGLNRARLLDELLSLEGIIVDNRNALIDEVIALSDEDQSLQKKYTVLKFNKAMSEEVEALVEKLYTQEDIKHIASEVDRLKKKYDTITSGKALASLFAIKAEVIEQMKNFKALEKFIEEISKDETYSIAFRQRILDECGLVETYHYHKGLDAAEKKYDEIIAMAPDTDLAKKLVKDKKSFFAELKGDLN